MAGFTEIIRGVLFTGFGLGFDYDHSTFRDPRMTIGCGVRIQVPVLPVPIQLDLGTSTFPVSSWWGSGVLMGVKTR